MIQNLDLLLLLFSFFVSTTFESGDRTKNLLVGDMPKIHFDLDLLCFICIMFVRFMDRQEWNVFVYFLLWPFF